MPELIKSEHASVSGHWYTKDGEPAYEIVGANGKKRSTDMRDARKLGLVPSVTTIIACAAKPFLQTWKEDQIISACLENRRKKNEPANEYAERIRKYADEYSKLARERGTLVHAWVQGGFEGESLPPNGVKYYELAKDELINSCGNEDWICEKSFATSRYGGKVDLQSRKFIIDIKTTEKDLTTIKTYNDHWQQLAAYNIDKDKECGILYVNVLSKESRLIFVTEEELSMGWRCFSALLDFWYAKNNF